MGVGVIVLNILDKLTTKDGLVMLGIGLFTLSLNQFSNSKENK